ncbi:MAG: TldD/PmbA family protein [Bacteroidales bacterium]|nr:TldD/PmbA family protein [Bacteroidales bacterium]MDD4670139.1 TldD/PmbA family protein [Bacteroidales bacterium]
MKTDTSIAAAALQIALESGAQNARISISRGVENSVIVINNKIDRLLQSTDNALYIQLYIDGRYGSFSTNMMDVDLLRKFITKAARSTVLLAEDECRVLPDKELYYRGNGEDLLQYDSTIESIPTEQRIEDAMRASGEIFGTDKRLLLVEAEYGDMLDYNYTIDSQGFEGSTLQSSYTISADCTVRGRGDRRSEGWWYESSLFYDKLKIEGCSTIALRRSVDSLSPKTLKSGKYNMVIENTVSSKMVAPIISALTGSAIQQGNSFLLNTIGKKIFSDKLTLLDRPHLKGYAGSRYFDSEGLSTKEMNIITKGVVNTYFIDTYFSKKLNIPTTIESPSVLLFSKEKIIDGKNLSLSAIIKDVDKGILVTGFNGGNFNSSTGDYSFGVQGFYFEKGNIVHPVSEMNITGNLISLWNNLLYIGDDARDCAKWQIPSLAFENVDFSGM